MLPLPADAPARPARAPVDVVAAQHAEETADLHRVRSVLVRAPHVKLHHLERVDERLAANIDGLAVAGEAATAHCTQALERPEPGRVFAAAVQAIQQRDPAALDRLLAVAHAEPATARGLVSAFGWVPAQQLQGVVQALLQSKDPWRRSTGIAACRLHGVDPGAALDAALHAGPAALRAEALRTAAALGRTDLLGPVRAALQEEALALEAACALCLLGEPLAALPVLQALALGSPEADPGSRARALALLLQAAPFSQACDLVRTMARSAGGDAGRERQVVQACGWLGDPRLLPWLIERMGDDRLARPAGESFATITGADLAALDLERKASPAPPSGPSDDPADPDVALDEDESLPWPDPEAVRRWWAGQAAALPAAGRCFMGAAPGIEQGQQVLRTGAQRQRRLAAHWLCLLQPGRRLFNTAAPAWRQKRALAPAG
jgi:uncharacterized protein (TIGR02270 family)